MKKYKYKNYEEYINCQMAANKKKGKNIWAKEKNIKAIAKYLRSRHPSLGLCHGVRQGLEQIWFNKYLTNCFVWGTEIGEVAGFNTIRWDFNKPKKEWMNKPVGTRLFLYPPFSNQLLARGVIQEVNANNSGKIKIKRKKDYKNKMLETYVDKSLGG